MTDLIFFSTPWLLIIPLAAILFALIAKILYKISLFTWISAAVHALCIAALVYCGGGLTDVFAVMIISLAVSCIYDRAVSGRKKGEDRQ